MAEANMYYHCTEEVKVKDISKKNYIYILIIFFPKALILFYIIFLNSFSYIIKMSVMIPVIIVLLTIFLAYLMINKDTISDYKLQLYTTSSLIATFLWLQVIEQNLQKQIDDLKSQQNKK